MDYLHCRRHTQIPIRVQISIPKMITVMIKDLDIDQNLSPSPCKSSRFCTVQRGHRVWSLNLISGNVNKP